MGSLQTLAAAGWMDLFQAMFSANTDNWAETLVVWDDLFRAEGRSNSEICAAVVAISKRSPMPRFAPEFLEALRQEFRAQDQSIREQQEAARVRAVSKPVLCRTCGDSGWVVDLPHLETINGLEWCKPYRTMAATCHCGLGHHIHGKWSQAHPTPKPVMTFSEYQQRNPYWSEMWQLRAKERQAEVAAYKQQHGAQAWEQTVKRILARYQGGDQ